MYKRQDGTPCHGNDPLFGTTTTTLVRLLDDNSLDVVPPVEADDLGTYTFHNTPSGTYHVHASCEGAAVTSAVQTDDGAILDLTLPNTAPRINTLTAATSGSMVYRVAPGTTVDVSATTSDPEGHPLSYTWISTTPGVVSANTPTRQWTLPNSVGTRAQQRWQ